MKIVVIGGTGLIGSRVVHRLRSRGHDALAASPGTGVNSVTGEGLAGALAGAQVVVDVSNSPSFEDRAVMEFFRASTGNLLRDAKAAGVQRLVALSVVGTERLLEGGYFRAKLAQEELISASAIPFTIVRATQFFEFLPAIGELGFDGSVIRLPGALMQPISADEVADAVADFTLAPPVNGVVEVGGPEAIGIDEAVRRSLAHSGDPRRVVTDASAKYYGIRVDDRSLTPDAGARLSRTTLAEWLRTREAATAAGAHR